MKWYAIIFMAIVIEGIITYAKTLVVKKQIQWQIVAAMVLGIGCALAFGIDLFEIAGIAAKVPYVGMILTGILLSRGANYVYDLIGKITKINVETSEYEKYEPTEDAEG